MRATAATTHADLARNLTGLVSEDPRDLRRRLLAVMELYQNEDTNDRRIVVEVIVEGRPAFWTTANYHDQKARNFFMSCMRMPIPDALVKHYGPDIVGHPHQLDKLVPINRQAVEALRLAYDRIGVWLEPEELEQRCVRDLRKKVA